MPTLIAILSTGKGTWNEVLQLIQAQSWNKVFLITNQFGKDNFSLKKDNLFWILIDNQLTISEIAKQIKSQLKTDDLEIALNLASGTGKEHTALLKAIMDSGLNFRLVSIKNGLLEIF